MLIQPGLPRFGRDGLDICFNFLSFLDQLLNMTMMSNEVLANIKLVCYRCVCLKPMNPTNQFLGIVGEMVELIFTQVISTF
jgi:hypothetical protein